MTSAWDDAAVDYVQAIADTKYVLSHRYSQRMYTAPSMEDKIADASAAQDEIGHVRQLFNILRKQGKEESWLKGEREVTAYSNAATIDSPGDTWNESVVKTGLADRASWLLLTNVIHADFDGLADKISEEEYFHLEHQEGWLQKLADERTNELRRHLESELPCILSFIGPESYTADADPLIVAGFTEQSVADLREALLTHYRSLFEDTRLSFDALEFDATEDSEWNASRRRIDGGGIRQEDVATLSGTHSSQYKIQ